MPIDFYQISFKVFLKNQEGKILILKTLPNPNFGSFDFPGGRINEDEFSTPIPEIINREIKEELGNIKYHLHFKPVSIGRHQSPKGHRVMFIFFEADYLGGEIKISEEHQGYKWIDLKNSNIDEFFTSGIKEGVVMYLSEL